MFKTKIDQKNIPRHISIIMDGNGRWAKKKGFLRAFGHEQGIKAVRDVVEGGAEINLEHLTLYAFSTENWNRPKREVETLMRLLVNSLRKEMKTFMDNDIQLYAIGNLKSLPIKAQKELHEVMAKTKDNKGMILTLALSYGSREELIHMVREVSEKVKNEDFSSEAIDESIINQHLYTRKLPDVDLLIRTSGEQRISNFLLWQIAYAELYFTNILWPDFRKENLYEAIFNYQTRERRFGKTSEQIS